MIMRISSTSTRKMLQPLPKANKVEGREKSAKCAGWRPKLRAMPPVLPNQAQREALRIAEENKRLGNLHGWELEETLVPELQAAFSDMRGGQDVERGRKMMARVSAKCGMALDKALELANECGDKTFDQFVQAFQREREICVKQEALNRLRFLRIFAERLPGGTATNPLCGLLELTEQEQKELGAWVIETASHAVRPAMSQEPRNAGNIQKEKLGGNDVEKSMKFEVVEMGTILDYNSGIEKAVGLPSAKVREAMEAEHTRRPNSEFKFKPGNYDTETTPAGEWKAVTDRDEGIKVSGGPFGREIPDYKELTKIRVAKEAGLTEEEVIGLILYTGPMYMWVR